MFDEDLFVVESLIEKHGFNTDEEIARRAIALVEHTLNMAIYTIDSTIEDDMHKKTIKGMEKAMDIIRDHFQL